jgi:hypothetical protein
VRLQEYRWRPTGRLLSDSERLPRATHMSHLKSEIGLSEHLRTRARRVTLRASPRHDGPSEGTDGLIRF